MILRIDTASSIPVYAQIVDQVKRAIASGSLKSGDPLPSLRETAIKLRVNPLTVNKAYKQLETEGFIETRHGVGSFVTADQAAVTDSFRRETLERAIDNVLVDAAHFGVAFDDLKKLVDRRIESANDSFDRDNFERSNENDE